MARKRAMGAGAKPKGPYHGNTKMLGVRVRPEVRAELDALRKERGWSLSQETQRALDSWIRWQRGPTGPALVAAIFKVVEQVKAETGEALDEPFTSAATRTAVNELLVHIWPPPLRDSAVKVPDRIRARVAREVAEGRLPSEVEAFELTPAGVGRRAAGFVIMRIENAAS